MLLRKVQGLGCIAAVCVDGRKRLGNHQGRALGEGLLDCLAPRDESVCRFCVRVVR